MSPVLIVQFLLTAAACFALWRWCRTQPRVVIAGFLIRALVGQALFWISYLKLPFARSLQTGNGFWFFAIDGPHYLNYAVLLLGDGPREILFLGDRFPSRFFVQTLTTFVAAFGEVASVAILLNCMVFLATCSIVKRFGRNDIVLAAIAFCPALVLFSLQPLKDAFFLMLMAALIYSYHRWEELWRGDGSKVQLLGWSIALFATTYALAAIRWYFAIIAWAASAIFAVIVIAGTRRRGLAIVAHLVLFIALPQAARYGALDMPPSFSRLVNPATAIEWRPTVAKSHITMVRSGFETSPGATTITPGAALETPSTAVATTTTPPPAPTKIAVKPKPQPSAAKSQPKPKPQASTAKPNPPTPKPQPAPKPLPVSEPQPAPLPIMPASSIQQSFVSRLITGFAALFVPRTIAEALGILNVGGGRGLWLFAETDTIFLDLVLLYTIFSCVRNLRSGRSQITATFVWCLLLLIMTAGPMVYTVNNFGTLFRLRLMVFFLVAILPLTLRTQRTDAVQ